MVFVPPHDPRYFIKRVVGIPGDHALRQQDCSLTQRLNYEFWESVIPGYAPRSEYIEETDDVNSSINSRIERAQEWTISEGQHDDW